MKPAVSRTLGVATLAAVALGITACSSDSDSGSSQGSSDNPVNISYMHRLPDGDGMTKVNDIVAEWNDANPNIQVTATKFDGQADEMITKLKADVEAGTAACLAQLSYSEVPTMFSEGNLEDVTDIAQDYVGNFSEGAVTAMTVGDQIVGLPQDTGPLVYYYNAQAFDDLGIDVPTTTDELADAARKAAESDKYIVAFEPDEAPNWLSAQAAAAGGDWYQAEDDAWKVDTEDAGSQKVAALWQGLLDDDATMVANRWGDEFKQALVNQDLIGTIGAAWEAPLLAGDMADTDNAGNWAVVELPKFGSEQLTGPDGGSGVAVLKGCDNPEAAMEFSNWFNTQIDALTSQGLVVAATGSVTTPDDIKEFYGGQDVFDVLSAANATLSPDFSYIPGFPAVNGEMTQAAAAASTGSASVMDIFTAAQKASVATLENAGLPVKE